MIEAALAARDLRWFRAPGRVNLMGDHTDYNQGLVLPMAIDRDLLIGVRPRSDGLVRIRSLDVHVSRGEVVVVAADGSTDPGGSEPGWERLVAAVVRALAERGRPAVGIDAGVASAVPMERGLASSAAFEVAVGLALSDAAEWSLRPAELAMACRDAEEVATGVPCGIMDQLACLLGRAGQALRIDCRSLEVRPVQVPADLAVLALDPAVPRRLEASGYAELRAACEADAARLGIPALRDATLEQIRDEPRARHVVSEDLRVEAVARALDRGQIAALSEPFVASHASLRDDLGVSTPELDGLIEALVGAGAVGARPTGAGWGGSVVALAERRRAASIAERAATAYGSATGLRPTWFVCRASEGAGPVEPRTT